MQNRIVQFLQDNQAGIKKTAFFIAAASSAYLTFRGSKLIIDADDNIDSIQRLQVGASWILSNTIFISRIADLAQKLHTSQNHATAQFLEGVICGNFLGNLPLTFHYCQKLGDMITKNDEDEQEEAQRFEL